MNLNVYFRSNYIVFSTIGSSTAAPQPSTSAPTTTTTTTKTIPPSPTAYNPLAGFCNGRADGNYAHPSRCDQFISCVAKRIVYVRNCPAGLYYNAKTDQCDWKRNVNCPGKHVVS